MWRTLIDTSTLLLSASVLIISIYILFFALKGILLRNKVAPVPSSLPISRVLVIVPAHNEAHGIGPCVRSVVNQEYPPDLFRLVVIADNCTDDTEYVADAQGAEVWTRNNPAERGKGHALEWALQKAASIDFDLVLIVDADSTLDRFFLRSFCQEAEARFRQGISAFALQCRYEFEERSVALGSFDAITRASKAAENRFTYLPRSEMGLVNLLQGNGFAVTKQALQIAPFMASSIVEDAEYAISLALAGIPVHYVDHAVITSRMTAKIRDAAPQRIRWAGGILQLIARSVPKLIFGSFRTRSWKLAEAAVMLLCTSRMLLIYATAAAMGMVALNRHGQLSAYASIMVATGFVLQAGYLWCVLNRASDQKVSSRSILGMPFYWGFLFCMQLCSAVGFGRGRWNRTVR